MIVPLTEAERAIRMRFEFGLALRHLDEAEQLAAWGRAPHACIHSAYYAMYHCAAASLFASGGVGPRRSAPASRVHVIEHFGRLVEADGDPLAWAATALAGARLDRMAADYGSLDDGPPADEKQVTAEARRMVEACRARWTLAPPEPSEP